MFDAMMIPMLAVGVTFFLICIQGFLSDLRRNH